MHVPKSGWPVQRRDAPTESPAPEFSAAGTVNHPIQEPLSPSIIPIGQVLAAEDDGEELPSDLDDLFADAEPSGAVTPRLVDSDDEGEEPLVSKPTGEEECQPQRIVRDPGMPSQKDIDEHEAGGHCTYRAWCEACVEGRGTGTPHKRGMGQESKVPILAFDYLFYILENKVAARDELDLTEIEACDMKILVAIDTTSGSVFAHVVQKKGVEDDRYSVDKLADDVAWLGYSEIIMKSDNEPAIVQLLKEVLKSLKVSSLDKAMEEHPAPYDSKGNGAAENAVKQVQGLLRTHKSALEWHISKSIPREHPVIAWMVEYVAFLLTTRRVKTNGLTPYQHLRGKQFV